MTLGKDKARSMLRQYEVKGAVFFGAVGARDVLMRFFSFFFFATCLLWGQRRVWSDGFAVLVLRDWTRSRNHGVSGNGSGWSGLGGDAMAAACGAGVEDGADLRDSSRSRAGCRRVGVPRIDAEGWACAAEVVVDGAGAGVAEGREGRLRVERG